MALMRSYWFLDQVMDVEWTRGQYSKWTLKISMTKHCPWLNIESQLHKYLNSLMANSTIKEVW